MTRWLIITLVTSAAIHLAAGSVCASVILLDLDEAVLDEAAMVSPVKDSIPADPVANVYEPTDQAGMGTSSVTASSVTTFCVACVGLIEVPRDTRSEKLLHDERSLHIAPFLKKRLRPPCGFSELVASNSV